MNTHEAGCECLEFGCTQINRTHGCTCPEPRGVRYHVLVADELIPATETTVLPEGFRFIEQEPTDPERHPGMHWWLVEDINASSEFEGKNVDLIMTRVGSGRAVITERRIIQ